MSAGSLEHGIAALVSYHEFVVHKNDSEGHEVVNERCMKGSDGLVYNSQKLDGARSFFKWVIFSELSEF